MTDYYPLLARAVAGLEKSTGEARRALYERARNALLAQLRSSDPPLSETEITRERLALEEAVRRVEADAARQLRSSPLGGSERPPPPPSAVPPPPPSPAPAPPRAPAPQPRFEAGGAPPPRPPQGRPPMAHAEADEARPPRSPQPALPAGADGEGASGRRDADAAPAARPAEAARGAQTVREAPAGTAPDEPFFDPLQPRVDQDDARSRVRPERGAPPEPGPTREPEAATPSPGARRRRPPGPLPRQPVDLEPGSPTAARRGLIAAVLTVLVITGLGAAAYWQRDTISGWFGASRTVTAPTPRDQAQRPKASDRVQQDGQTAQPQQPDARPGAPPALVAQRVVLYEEDPANPEGNRYVGSALWRTETVSPGPGLSPELAIRADVEIPERRLAMTMSIRRNTDQALPASHTVEIIFNLPADFAFGGVANVPGLLMKEAEQSRGAPLSGLAVKVTTGFFLIGLSAAEADLQRNMQLLKERGWFDIPMVYNNGRRAILAIEKGTPGERTFAEAFATWSRK